MKGTESKSLPVVMYHYVNELAGSITLSPACFEEHCRVLAEQGWRGVGLDEAEDFLIQGKALPKRSILLTFDDGYLDNYMSALPALHRHGHKGVVFAVAKRLEPGDVPRRALDRVLSGKEAVPPEISVPVRTTSEGFHLREDVFLNYAESRIMDAHGTLALASHGMGHYGVFTGPDYKGFCRPRTQYRTFYRTEAEPLWGMPEFSVKPGLLHRAFIPNPDLVEAIRALVPQDFTGAAIFFAEEEKVRALEALVAGFAGRLGRYESDEERKVRMWREIAGGYFLLDALHVSDYINPSSGATF